jgi:hypothetical protein
MPTMPVIALDPGLLEGFAGRSLGDGRAEVDRAPGDGPVVVVGAAYQQDLVCVVDDDHVDGRDEAVGPRRLTPGRTKTKREERKDSMRLKHVIETVKTDTEN